MANELEYVVKDALILCDKGTMPSPFKPTNGKGVKISGLITSNSLDKIPNQHIMPFGACNLQNGKPCTPEPLEWKNTYGVKINGGTTLLKRSCIKCASGGKISFLNSGQIPLPQNELDKLLEENGEKQDDSSWGWWDTAELIPVMGSIIGMVRETTNENWAMVALNVGFLVLDILGVISFGATTAISTAAKGSIKASIKIVAKKVAQTTSKALTKGGVKKLAKGSAKALSKGIAKTTAKLATKKGIICVTACFTAGTKVAVKNGHKPIEKIQVGDLVWAYNEKTGESNLKPVVHTMQKEVDATIQLSLGNEIIETTAEHPFYTQSGWKDAADLTKHDLVKTKNGKWQQVKATNFLYSKKKVYNFEVQDWHTYFVGLLMWLVHNSKVCLVELAKAGVKYAKNILNGQLFDKAMRKAYGIANSQIKMENGKVLDVLTNNEIISHKFTQLSEVTFDTAKKYIDEIGKKYGDKITNSRKLSKQISTREKKQILEIPPQKIKNEQYQKIVEYAWKEKRVKIREISGKALEEYNKIAPKFYN